MTPAASQLDTSLSTMCEKIPRYSQVLTKQMADHFIVRCLGSSPNNTKHLCVLFQLPLNFIFMEHSDNLEKIA